MTTLTSKGQVTIPKRLRDYLGLRAGSEVTFATTAEGDVVVKAAAKPRKSRFAKLRGTASAGLTTDQIMRLTRGE